YVYGQRQSAPSPAQVDATAEAQIVELINQARAQHGLQPLAVDDRLTEAGRKHSSLMVQKGSLSHQFAGEPPPQKRMTDAGVPADAEIEKVVLNQTAADANDTLMQSPRHRTNILDAAYNAVGGEVARQGENIGVPEDLPRRFPQLPEPQAEAAVQV